LAAGTEVLLAFNQDISSDTAHEGDTVAFVLSGDLKIGNVVVARSGCKAMGEVAGAYIKSSFSGQLAGTNGRIIQLYVRVNYLKVGDVLIRLRVDEDKKEPKGVADLGPVSRSTGRPINRHRIVKINKGTTVKAFTSEDISLPPMH